MGGRSRRRRVATCWNLSRRRPDRLSDGLYAGEVEIDAGKELLAVVVARQLPGHLPHEGVLRRIELRPPSGDRPEDRRPIRVAREKAARRRVLSGEAEDEAQERGGGVELRYSQGVAAVRCWDDGRNGVLLGLVQMLAQRGAAPNRTTIATSLLARRRFYELPAHPG